MQAPGLICASSARPSRSRVDGSGRQLRHDPVAFGQQRRQRHVAGLQFALLGFRRARALMVEHMHVEGPGPDGNLAPDLAQANDADGRTVERAGAAEAGVVAARRVLAVERPVGAARGLDAFDGDEAVELVELARQHQHQPEGVLGAGDVGAPPQREQLDALLGAGGGVDVAQPGAEFLHDLELAAPRQDRRASTRNNSTTSATQSVQIGAHLGFGRHHPHLGGIEPWRALPHALAPAGEIRLVGRHEIGEGGAALLARRSDRARAE